ncbi:MAG TPA: ADP-forming succinate--CoA ligase subunit beta, partial [Planctomycetaceae bacterium]|nr:ADP-forming succinate--CoA ligase subunit beta [Planctomycetaceae bacterium]
MKIHEYQGKQLLAAAKIAVPRGFVVESPEAAAQAFRDLGGTIAVVKSQIHAGGRGKGRFKEYSEQAGVVLVKSAEEAAQNAARMLGKTLVTKQTGPVGKTVNVLLVEEGLKIARELYLGVVVDRAAGGPVLIMSSEGGTEIEEVAARSPEKILREPIDAGYGLFAYQVTKLGYKLGLTANAIKSAHKFLPQVARFFIDNDCSLTEINPLVVTEAGDLIALDAKMTFDDNAMFRHKPFEALRDLSEEDDSEIRAAAAGLSYVKLDGNIGCLVNGAGLAMSTMDLIKLHGGEPANFLDVGGGANVDQVTEAFRIILAD